MLYIYEILSHNCERKSRNYDMLNLLLKEIYSEYQLKIWLVHIMQSYN